jgi:hypothetical protein
MTLSAIMSTGRIRSLVLLGVFIAAFVILATLMPYGREHSSVVSLALYVGLLSLFKLLGQFEKPPA